MIYHSLQLCSADVSNMQKAMEVTESCCSKNQLDAFFAVSDHNCPVVLKVAVAKGIKIRKRMGIISSSNEMFTGCNSPRLPLLTSKANKMGRDASDIYSNHIITSGC